jgi:hypothetical protein
MCLYLMPKKRDITLRVVGKRALAALVPRNLFAGLKKTRRSYKL